MITVIGEAVIDLAQTADETTVRATPGGSALNIAVGAARLGHPAALMARLSRDSFGQLLRRHAARNGVDLSAAPEADEPTTIAVPPPSTERGARSRLYFGGAASSQWSSADLAWVPPATAVLHIGSLAWCAGASATRVLRTAARLRKRGALMCTDLNVHPEVMGTPGRGRILLDRTVRSADVVRASVEDIGWLYPGRAPQAVAQQWLGLGPSLVVVTSANVGAMAFRGPGLVLHRQAYPADIDAAGAEDAFTAVLLAALYRLSREGGTVQGMTARDLGGALDAACAAAGVLARAGLAGRL
jgi:fructokinase